MIQVQGIWTIDGNREFNGQQLTYSATAMGRHGFGKQPLKHHLDYEVTARSTFHAKRTPRSVDTHVWNIDI